MKKNNNQKEKNQILESQNIKIQQKKYISHHKKDQKYELIRIKKQPQQPSKQCFICTSSYNLNRKIPVIACKNNHTFCLNCIIQCIKMSKLNCPLCRELLQPFSKNQIIFNLIKKQYDQKNKQQKNNEEQHKNQIISKKKLIFSKNTKKLSNLNHLQVNEKDKIIKKISVNNFPSLIILQPEIKQYQKNKSPNYQYQFQLRFTYHYKNIKKLSFGLCYYDKFLMKIVHNLGFDTEIISFFSKQDQKQKKKQEEKIKEKNSKIMLKVSLKTNTLDWVKQNNQQNKNKNQIKNNKSIQNNHNYNYSLICSQSIDQYPKVGEIVYYVFVTLYNQQDYIQLNK